MSYFQKNARKKIKFILNLFNHNYLFNKSVLDIGIEKSELNYFLFKMGSDVTVLNSNQDYLNNINKIYPEIKTIKQNLNINFNSNIKYDIIFHIDALNLIKDWESHLKQVCEATGKILILESSVCDLEELEVDFDFDKFKSRTSAKNIENILFQNKMHYCRLDHEDLNFEKNIYNWKVSNSGKRDINLKRFWVCSKDINIIKNINFQKYNINFTKQEQEQEQKKINYFNEPSEKNQSPGITIIIPAYKASNFINECIDSIKKQKINQNIEIIIGIDSCEETLNHFKNNIKIYKDVKICWFENKVGPYVIKNSLIDLATHENILFFDADDIMMDDFIEQTIKGLALCPLVRYKFYNFENGKNIKDLKNLKNLNIFSAGIMAIKKEIFIKYNGFEGWTCAADAEFWSRINFYKENVHLINKPIFYRRLHSNNLEFSLDTNFKSEIRQKYLSIIKNKNKNNNWELKNRTTSCFSIQKNLNFEKNKLPIQIEKSKIAIEENIEEKLNFKVYHYIPWSTEKNIGKCYNEFMELIGENDWACFLDGDAIHTTTYFGKYIEKVITNNKEYSLFTCLTNRVGTNYQLAKESDWKNDSQKYNRDLGQSIWDNYGTNVIDITNKSPLSGVLILINKKSWNQVGGFKEEKMLSIDNDIHLKIKHINGKVGLMQGIYVQHWYRGGDRNSKTHLL